MRALALAALAVPPALLASAAFGALATFAALTLGACEEQQAHLLYAHRYDPDRGCLGPAEAVEVLDGPDPGPCGAPRCWHTPAGEVLVTPAASACDAPPDYVDGTADPPGSPCAAALAALAALQSTEPPDAGDAGDAGASGGLCAP